MKTPSLPALILIACALGAPLTGCISVGREFDMSKTSEIRSGVTTRADLERLFGPPYSVRPQNDGTTKLIWQHTTAGFAVGVTDQQELFVTVGADGRVKDFSSRKKGE